MTKRFAYEPRVDCVCGNALNADEPSATVCKRAAWGEVRFLRCRTCGSWCQSPQLTPGSLAAWFASSDYFGTTGGPGAAYTDYFADEASRLREARHRVEHDLRALFRPGARLLEIGCATGSLLAALRDAGYRVAGVDVSEPLAARARAVYGLAVHVGSFEDAPLPEAGFDGVLMFGSIANLPRLVESLERIRRLLSVHGLLVFNAPVANAWIVRYLYRSNFWMFAPSVNFLPTETGCRTALARAGFTVVMMRQDFQRPSLRKLLHHAKLDGVLALMKKVGLEEAGLPISLPAPSVRFVVARSDATGS
jgi:SAM-dependent methyltransferase